MKKITTKFEVKKSQKHEGFYTLNCQVLFNRTNTSFQITFQRGKDYLSSGSFEKEKSNYDSSLRQLIIKEYEASSGDYSVKGIGNRFSKMYLPLSLELELFAIPIAEESLKDILTYNQYNKVESLRIVPEELTYNLSSCYFFVFLRDKYQLNFFDRVDVSQKLLFSSLIAFQLFDYSYRDISTIEKLPPFETEYPFTIRDWYLNNLSGRFLKFVDENFPINNSTKIIDDETIKASQELLISAGFSGSDLSGKIDGVVRLLMKE